MAITLGEIAVRFGLELAGDPGQTVHGDCFARDCDTRDAHLLHRREIPPPARRDARDRGGAAARNGRGVSGRLARESRGPYASYARIAALLYPPEAVRPGVAAGACIAAGAVVPASSLGRRLLRDRRAACGSASAARSGRIA